MDGQEDVVKLSFARYQQQLRALGGLSSDPPKASSPAPNDPDSFVSSSGSSQHIPASTSGSGITGAHGLKIFGENVAKGFQAIGQGIDRTAKEIGKAGVKVGSQVQNIVVAPIAPLHALNEKSPLEALFYKKRPLKTFMNFGPNADVCWLLYAEGLIVGRLRTIGTESVVDVGAVAPLAGPDAEDLGYITCLPGSYEIQVEGIIVAADSPEDRAEWLDAFANQAAQSRGASRHEAIRGTIWSYVVTQDLAGLEACLAAAEPSGDVKYVDSTDGLGKSALHYAAEMKEGAAFISLLFYYGANPDILDDQLCTPLFAAVLSGNARCVDALVRGGADKEVKDLSNRTPFLALVVSMIEHMENDSLYDVEEHRAVLERLADANLLDDEAVDGLEPIHRVVAANVNARDLSGKTALHLMALSKHKSSYEALVVLLNAPCKCDPWLVHGEEQRTALHDVVLDFEVEETGDLSKRKSSALLEYGARPNAGDVYGDTPLMYVLRGAITDSSQLKQHSYPILTKSRVETARLLIQFGARLDVANTSGKTPLDAAKAQRVTFDDAVARWTARKEPPQTPVLAGNPDTLSYLTQVHEPSTAPALKTSLKSPLGPPELCCGCRKSFTALNRKTICKKCGLGFCSVCSVKSFTMAKGMTSIKDRVCDACFNCMCTLVEEAADTLHRIQQDRSKLHAREETERRQLFAGVQERVEARGGPASPAEMATSANAAAHQTKDMLLARGDRLAELNNRTLEMRDKAENFALNAKKLREQQEKSWF